MTLDHTYWRSFLSADTGADAGASTSSAATDTTPAADAGAASAPAADPLAPFVPDMSYSSELFDQAMASRNELMGIPSAEKEEAKEETTEEVATETPEEKVAEQAKPEETKKDEPPADDKSHRWLDEDTAWLAEQNGISREDAAEFGSRKALNKAIVLASKLRAEKSAAPAGETAKKASEKPAEGVVDPLFEGLDLSWADEDTMKALKAISEKHKSLEDRLNGVTQIEQQREAIAFQEDFDRTIREINPDLFGNDHISKASPEVAARRAKVFEKVAPEYVRLLHAGKKPDLKELAEGYTRFFFHKEIEARNAVVAGLAAKKQSSQRLASPAKPRPVASHKHPSESPELAELWNGYLSENGHR